MDPIITGGIVSAGKTLLTGIASHIASPSVHAKASANTSFPDQLGKASNQQTFKTYANSKAISKDLVQDPEINSFMERNKANDVFVEKRADGSAQLLSSSGEVLVLPEGSEPCKLALQYFDRCLEEKAQLSDFRTNAVLLDA
jgi:hypothetical protein